MIESHLAVPLSFWVFFLLGVAFLLVLDLGVFNRRDHEIKIKESLALTLFYVVLALLFGAWIYYELGSTSAKEYLTGYLIEKSLSLDNIFIISLIFSHLHIPRLYQHRVLFFGVLGVIVLRGIMIGVGASLISHFSWIIYVFAIFLIFTGAKMLRFTKPSSLENSILLNFLNKFLPVSKLHGHSFFVRQSDKKQSWLGKWSVTPLFIALLLVEFTDLVFAVDSVPAIFLITDDPFIVYTSNIFAILGLRALYFALEDIIHRFVYLKQALALILIFIGSKVFIVDYFHLAKFPATLSLTITLCLLLGGVVYSWYRSHK